MNEPGDHDALAPVPDEIEVPRGGGAPVILWRMGTERELQQLLRHIFGMLRGFTRMEAAREAERKPP